MSTNCKLFPLEDRYCRGRNLSHLRYTSDIWNSGRSVFALSVGDTFRNGNSLVGWEIGDIIWFRLASLSYGF